MLLIELFGSFDTEAGAVFATDILPLLDGWSTVTFDLRGLTSFDAEGMFSLLVARDALAARGGRVRLRGGRDVVAQWGEMSQLFDIEGD